MSLPKVSVCIPAYQQTKYLEKTLDSILNQDFSDYEIILTDDSPDDMVKELIKKYDFSGRMNYIKNPKNLGSPANWNKAIALARSEYIKIMHHDDWFTENSALKKLIEALDQNPESDLAFSASLVQNIDSKTSRINQATSKQIKRLKTEPAVLFLGNFIGAPSATIYRAKIKEQFDENLKWLVDVEFYIRLLLKNPEVVYLARPLVATIAGAKHNITGDCSGNKAVEIFENFYVYDKIKMVLSPRHSQQYQQFIYENIIKKYQIKSIAEIKSTGFNGKNSLKFKILILINPLLLRLVWLKQKLRYFWHKLQVSSNLKI
jgi:glycosyltransferase involved in cell wall biosynthesis